MLVNDEIYFQTFCTLLDKVVAEAGLEVNVEALSNSHFQLLSRKINQQTQADTEISPTTFRDYRYIYLKKKKFSIRENRLDLLCEYIGYLSWVHFRSKQASETTTETPEYRSVKLLVINDKRVGLSSSVFEGQIAEMINNRYEELKYEHAIDNLQIIFSEDSPVGIKKIREMGSAHEADLVVWPEYVHGNTPKLRVPFLIVDPNRSDLPLSKRKPQSHQPVEGLETIYDGAFLEETDILLFTMLGMEAYRREEQQKACQYFEHLLTLDPEGVTPHFYLGAIYQNQDHLDQASQHYHEVLSKTASDHDFYEKAVINLVFILMREAGYEEAIDLLKRIEHNHSTQTKRIHALLYQAYMLKGDKASAQEHLLLWDKRYAERMEVEAAGPLPGHLMVMEGDSRVLTSKRMDPLLESTIVHQDEPIFFMTTETDLSLMSMENFAMFHLQPSKQELPLKKSLVPFEEFRPLRQGLFEQYATTNRWILLPEFQLRLSKAHLPKEPLRLFLQFDYRGQQVRHTLPLENQKVVLNRELILKDAANQKIEDESLCHNIKLIAHQPKTRKSTVLFEIPGFIEIEDHFLRNRIKRFQSHLPDELTEQQLLLETAAYVYQQLGIIPTAYLTLTEKSAKVP